MSTLTLVTAPTVEPLTFLDVRDFMRVGDGEESLVNMLISAARSYVEEATGRALITQTWKLTFHDTIPSGEIRLPKAPLASVDSFAYSDIDNASRTLTTADYETVKSSKGASIIRMKDGSSWPSVYAKLSTAAITFTCGYGATGASLPSQLRMALMMLTLDYYENRNMRNIEGQFLPAAPAVVDRMLFSYNLRGAWTSVD